jgi:hypothetical protein
LRLSHESEMKFTEVYKLKPGRPVWVWVVHLARGRWWPGTIEAKQAINGRPRIVVRFECRLTRERQYYPAVRAGVITTAMRYLESRDPNIKGIDEPHFVPASLLERPEELELVNHQLNVVSTHRRRKESQQREASSRSRAAKDIASNVKRDEV